MTKKKEYDIRTAGSEMFQQFYDGSYCTMIGAGSTDGHKDWFDGINKALKEDKVGQIKTLYVFRGREMNEFFDLEGDNRYKDDLTFICFPLDGLDIGRLTMFKLKSEMRWFDDICDNLTTDYPLHKSNEEKKEPVNFQVTVDVEELERGGGYDLFLSTETSSGVHRQIDSLEDVGSEVQRYIEDYVRYIEDYALNE